MANKPKIMFLAHELYVPKTPEFPGGSEASARLYNKLQATFGRQFDIEIVELPSRYTCEPSKVPEYNTKCESIVQSIAKDQADIAAVVFWDGMNYHRNSYVFLNKTLPKEEFEQSVIVRTRKEIAKHIPVLNIQPSLMTDDFPNAPGLKEQGVITVDYRTRKNGLKNTLIDWATDAQKVIKQITKAIAQAQKDRKFMLVRAMPEINDLVGQLDRVPLQTVSNGQAENSVKMLTRVTLTPDAMIILRAQAEHSKGEIKIFGNNYNPNMFDIWATEKGVEMLQNLEVGA